MRTFPGIDALSPGATPPSSGRDGSEKSRGRRLVHQPGGGRRPLLVGGDGQRVGDAHLELAPRPRLALDPDLAAEQTHAALDEREPHAEAGEAPRGRVVALREELEELAHPLGRDAGPGVAHRDHGGAQLLARAHRHRHLALARELEGVGEQVEEEAVHERLVDAQARGLGRDGDAERDPLALGRRGQLRHHRLDQGRGPDFLPTKRYAVRLELHEEQDVVDQRVQAARVAEHAVEERRLLAADRARGAVAHQCRVAQDRVEWRAQLVRDGAEELPLDAVRADERLRQRVDVLLVRAEALLLVGEGAARDPELALQVGAQRGHRGAHARDGEHLADDLPEQSEGAPAREDLRRRHQRMEHECAARLAAHREGENEEALAGELSRRDRVEAPIGPTPEAGRAHVRLDQAREREPARLAEPAARAAQTLRLGREADERQVAVGLVGQPDGAGLEAELLHERLGDLLPALPDRVATREQIEQDLDRGEVDDGVVALFLDLGERLADVLVPALPRHVAHATSCVSAASSAPSRRRRSTSSHTAGVTPCSRPLSSSAVACASITPVPRSVHATRRSATASSPGTPARTSSAWCERTASTIAGGRLHASRIQPPTSAWSTPRAAASLRSIASASPALPTLCQYSSRKRMARMSRPTSWSTPAVKASSGSPARSRAASVLAATPTARTPWHALCRPRSAVPAGSIGLAGKNLRAPRYGSTATARSGPPLPPRIFIGSPMNTAPRGGSAARPARFSKMGTLAFVSARWARKSREGPWSIDAVSMPIERMRRAVVSHNAASSPTPGKWRCAVSPGAALPR